MHISAVISLGFGVILMLQLILTKTIRLLDQAIYKTLKRLVMVMPSLKNLTIRIKFLGVF